MRRIVLLVAMALVPLACTSSFGQAVGDVPEAGTAPPGPTSDASTTAPIVEAAAVDAAEINDDTSGLPTRCDEFERANLINAGGLWDDAQSTPLPRLRVGGLELERADNETDYGVLRSVTRDRGGVIVLTADVHYLELKPFTNATQRIRIFEIDPTPGVSPSAFAGLELDQNGWRVQWRRFDESSTAEQAFAAGSTRVQDQIDKIVFIERFHPTKGSIELQINGVSVIKESGLQNRPVTLPSSSWLVKVGLMPWNNPPGLKVRIDNICLAPF